MKKLICLILFFTVVFSGCTRVTEVDSKSFVTAIGFDKGETYALRFTFIFTVPSKNKSQGNNDETIVIEAPSLYSAIRQINSFKSKEIQLTHTQTVIFSEELAKEGLKDHIFALVRSNHFRPNTYVCIADKSSMEFLEKIDPSQSYHLENYFQMIFNKRTSGKRGDLNLYDAYFRMLTKGGAGVLPYCAINNKTINSDDNSLSENPSENPSEESEKLEPATGEFLATTDDFAINTVAGDSISKSKNRAEIQGAAIIKHGKFVALLGRTEASVLQLITNSLPDTFVSVSDPNAPDKMITCLITPDNKTRISVKCDKNPKIKININFEGDFIEVGEDSYYIRHPRKFEEYFEKKTKDAIEAFLYKIARDFNCDICGFSEAAKSQFLTIEDWDKYAWDDKFSLSEYEVNVNLTIRTYGELSQAAEGSY